MAHCQCKPSCRFGAAEGEPFHLSHDPRPEKQEERRAMLAERSRRGGAKTQENERRRKRKTCSLRSTDDILTELEQTLIAVDNSAGEVVGKASAKVKLIAEARATLKAAELENENRELRALLLERHPELKKQLKAVP